MRKEGEIIHFDDQELKHIKARRIKIEEQFKVICEGNIYLCKLLNNNQNMARIMGISEENPKSAMITIATALPKGKRRNILIEKLTEIGILNIVFIKTSRTQYTADNKLIQKLNKVSIEAAKQSHSKPISIKTSDLHGILTYSEKITHKYILHPEAENNIAGTHLLNELSKYQEPKSKFQNICEDVSKEIQERPLEGVIFLVGPEGGFTEEELETARQNGFKPLSLNTNLLRIETCCIYIAALVKEFSNDKFNN